MKILLSANKIATIDEIDFDLISEFNWQFDGKYAVTFIDGNKVYMHRMIMHFPKNLQVDHRDRDKLNNTRNNLRISTSSQNSINTDRSKSKLSKLPRGITRRGHLYVARIRANLITYYIGSFLTIQEAEAAYKLAQIKHHGVFALGE